MNGGAVMQHECKITVLEKKVFADYQEKYLADPKSGPCPFFNVGDTMVPTLSVLPFMVGALAYSVLEPNT